MHYYYYYALLLLLRTTTITTHYYYYYALLLLLRTTTLTTHYYYYYALLLLLRTTTITTHYYYYYALCTSGGSAYIERRGKRARTRCGPLQRLGVETPGSDAAAGRLTTREVPGSSSIFCPDDPDGRPTAAAAQKRKRSSHYCTARTLNPCTYPGVFIQVDPTGLLST